MKAGHVALLSIAALAAACVSEEERCQRGALDACRVICAREQSGVACAAAARARERAGSRADALDLLEAGCMAGRKELCLEAVQRLEEAAATDDAAASRRAALLYRACELRAEGTCSAAGIAYLATDAIKAQHAFAIPCQKDDPDAGRAMSAWCEVGAEVTVHAAKLEGPGCARGEPRRCRKMRSILLEIPREIGGTEAPARAERYARRECEQRGFAGDQMANCLAWIAGPPAPAGLGAMGTIGGEYPNIADAADGAPTPTDGWEASPGDAPGTRRFRSAQGAEIAMGIVAGNDAPIARFTEDALVANVKRVALCYEAALGVDPAATATIAASFVVDRTGHAALDALTTNDVQARVRGLSDCVMNVLRAAELGPPGSGPSGRIGVRWSFSPGKKR